MRNCEPTPCGPERGGGGNPPLKVRALCFYPTAAGEARAMMKPDENRNGVKLGDRLVFSRDKP